MTPERLESIRRGEITGQIATPYHTRDEAVDALVQELFRQGLGASALIVRKMQVDVRDLADALAQERGLK